ncbi:helix-turn-helix domain-containing protein [Tenacibaculum caenipelagi]|uniref:DNA-binding XRE family transcriptional regulator n=1 Tax=Tenacibaculum caenipelagi TaxID=1325435 RepID=A0A4R6TDB0_9FLAO|nr:helix-turn-helix transcriptional regulator [Tenacibaculum caenipelagi]TDQ22780.1 DNA-binding XRE family transcriptional regulator [Tenacibaculum caenipelagi]
MRIKELRKKHKETQSFLADLLDVSLRTIQNYENGSVTIPNNKLKVLAEHYNITVSEIFLQKEDHQINLDEIDANVLANHVVENWDRLMQNNLFSANFKAKAGEWALKVRKSLD